MAQEEEERINEENTAVNVISELPGRPFSITMEVPLFVTLLALALSGTVVSNVLLYRTCVHALHHTKDECQIFLAPEKSNTTKHLEEEVQKYTTYVTTVKTVIESLVPAVLSLFLGVWSDTYGRKPLVVWPLFGMSISAMMTVVYSLWDDLGPWWLILTVVPFSMTGGYTALFTGAFTYIADITTTANRSFRMLLLELAFASGSFLGALATTYLINAFGNVCVLLVVAVLYVFAYAFTNICLTESLNGALKGGLCTLLDLLLVKEMMETCFKRRPNHGRAQILLLTISNSLGIFILYGLGGLGYMYAREKLHWAVKEFSVYSAVNTLITAGGAILGLKLGARALGLGDLSLAIVGYLSAVAEFLTIAFARTSWHMYLASSFSAFKGLSAPLIRSHITKALPVEDIAKVFALLCAMEALCPLLSPLLYNTLYEATISTFPGAIFIMSAAIFTGCCLMIGMAQYYYFKSFSPSYQRIQLES